jgi:signal transduction histidine kinase/DNA-binding response OmpR family regulator
MLNRSAFRKIDRKIYMVFLIVIAIAIVNAVISTYTIRKSQRITSDIVNNTNPSLDALAKMNLLVTRSRMLVTNWVYLPNNQADKDSLRTLNNSEYIQLRGRFQSLTKNWQRKQHIATINKILTDYETLSDHQLRISRMLNNFDDYQDPVKRFAAEEILEREIIPRSEDITRRLGNIIREQTELAMDEQDKMLYQFNTLMILVLGIALLIIGSILMAAFIITRSIIVPILHVRGVIMQMGRGELPELKMKIPKNVVGEMLKALGFLIDGFRQTSRFVDEVGKANFDHPFTPLSSKDIQGHALLTMRNRLKAASEEDANRSWMTEGLANLNEIMRSSSDDFNMFLDKIIDTIVDHVNVQQAAIFLVHNDDLNDLHIQLGAYYALNNKILNSKRYELKEGLIGQAIASNKIISLDNISDPYFSIDTGIGDSKNCSIMIIPLATSGKVVGAIEVASIQPLSDKQKLLMEKMAEPVAASLFSVRANLITTQLLEESRKQAEELVYQEQELRKINNELTSQSQLLQQSEEELKAQQEELKQVNQELQDKAGLLEEQNLAIEDARQSLSFKAEQLEQSNKYKSAFLANMSHELRTPLNSILILAKLLGDNKHKNLEEKQIEHASVIHKSGSDLLMLINDILDLSKIEAGKVDLQIDSFDVTAMTDDMKMLFREFASEKQIDFKITTQIPENAKILSDKTRIEQVVKNLLSNAFKFTPAGGQVELKINIAQPETIFKEKSLLQADRVYEISVRDTGIGIPEDKQKLVFEAFQQADGSTSRKFGGTGLGLAISRELTHMLGGEMCLESIEGAGSTFIIYLPENLVSNAENTPKSDESHVNLNKEQTLTREQVNSINTNYQDDEIRDDRTKLQEGDKLILIIEDDYVFARMLMSHCHRFGFKAIIALQGDQGLAYALKFKPYAIILDMRLPVMDGWTVLKKLKEDETLKMIPVHVISSIDKKQLGLDMGAVSYLSKPAGKEEMESLFNRIDLVQPSHTRKLLYMGSHSDEMKNIIAVLREREQFIEIVEAANLEECTDQVRKNKIECLIIDAKSNDEGSQKMVQSIRNEKELKNLPLIFSSGNQDDCLREVESLFYKDADADREKSLDETQLFLDSVSRGRDKFENVQSKMNEMFTGKTVLLVDDDMRNIYSMTNILESEGLKVICAYDGLEAISKLETHDNIDIVLMDIMMPNMNGYEATATIRKNPLWANIPIIAVTAKAMNGDRDKCMEAGASDYLTKPFQTDQLITLMRVWMYK